MTRKGRKSFFNMTTDELRKATAEFDRPFVLDEFGPPNAAARKRLARAEKRSGRPQRRRGSAAG